jgi:uncharacterized DUF497 family protein
VEVNVATWNRWRVIFISGPPNPSDQRYAMIGMVENRLLFVAYAMRGERIRIISARKAEPYERRKYHDENREA